MRRVEENVICLPAACERRGEPGKAKRVIYAKRGPSTWLGALERVVTKQVNAGGLRLASRARGDAMVTIQGTSP